MSPKIFDDAAFRLYFWRQGSGVWWWHDGDEANLNAPDGSWAHVRDGAVSTIGPRDIWAEVEDAHQQWRAAGQPAIEDFVVHVTADGRTTIDLPS